MICLWLHIFSSNHKISSPKHVSFEVFLHHRRCHTRQPKARVSHAHQKNKSMHGVDQRSNFKETPLMSLHMASLGLGQGGNVPKIWGKLEARTLVRVRARARARARALTGPSFCPFRGTSVPNWVPFRSGLSLRLSPMAFQSPWTQICPFSTVYVPKMSLKSSKFPSKMSLVVS